MTTQVIYQSPKVDVKYENDSYSVVALEDLSVGELVLVELVVWGPKIQTIIAAIIYDKELSSELYPRNTVDPKEKMDMNVFRFDENYVIGRVFSKFNHSCVPNCHMGVGDFVNNSRAYGMWVHRKIKAGEELTIDYVNIGDVDYHDAMKEQHGIECSCTHEYIKSKEKMSKVHMKMDSTFLERDREFITEKVDQFFQSSAGAAHLRHVKSAKKLEKRIKVM